MENCVIINTNGVAYHPKDVKFQTMTVDELRNYLLNFPSDWPVVLSNNCGYTYGYVYQGNIRDARYDDDEVFD